MCWSVRGPQLPASVVLTVTYGELHPGSSRVPICLRNLIAHTTMIAVKVIVGKVPPANLVPLVAPLMKTSGESAHDHWKAKGWILDKLDIEGLKDWPQKEQRQARELLVKLEHLFANNDLDLGKTSLIKHHIHLTDRTAFKECYCQIPPHMHEDVKAHLQEKLDISAVQKSYSPWASTMVLVWKRDGS